MKRLYLKGTKLVLDTPYNKDEIQALKTSFPQARWDKIDKHWTIPLAARKRAISFANSWNIDVDDDLIRLQIPDHPIGDTTIRLEKAILQIAVPYETLQIHDLKAIPGIKWNPHHSHWETPYTNVHELIQWANKYNHPIPAHISTQADIETKKAQHSQNLTQATDANIHIPALQLELYPYQKAGVAYAAEKQRTFIADEMGLGKTLQALATTEYTNQYPALIICPTSLTEDWKTKIEEALPNRTIQTIEGRKTPNMTETDYTIIGYPNIHTQKQHLNNQKHNTLILDESHYCKNPDAQRTKAAKNIAKNIPQTGNILLLTGTPITNMPAEYAPQLEILDQINNFGGRWNFYKRYCGAYQDNWGHWQTYGSTNNKELLNKLQTHCYIRREKQQVLTDLPPLTHNTIHTTMDKKHRTMYNHALNDLQEWYTQQQEELAHQQGTNPTTARIRAHYATQNYETLIQLTELRKIAAHSKIPHATEWTQNANNQGQKIVIAAHHRHIVQTLANELNAPMIIGGQTPKDTEKAKHNFQNNPNTMNIIISIDAAAHGHTLTASHNMLFIEAPWTPAKYHQTAARIHRIGQNHPATIHNLINPHTIDQHIYNTLHTKTQNTQPAITQTAIQNILNTQPPT